MAEEQPTVTVRKKSAARSIKSPGPFDGQVFVQIVFVLVLILGFLFFLVATGSDTGFVYDGI